MKTKDIVTAGFSYQNVKVLKGDELDTTMKSHFGVPIWMPFTIKSFTWRDPHNKVNHIVFGVKIACCIVEANGSKNIVKTAIQGLNTRGTVKEYINHGDINISIKGVLVSKNNEYPQLEVDNLMRI